MFEYLVIPILEIMIYIRDTVNNPHFSKKKIRKGKLFSFSTHLLKFAGLTAMRK